MRTPPLSIDPNDKVVALVDRDCSCAYKLGSLGIYFYEYEDQTIGQVCQQRNMSVQQMSRLLSDQNTVVSEDLLQVLWRSSIEDVIDYLKKSHKYFIRQRLPFMGRMLQKVAPERFDDPSLINDLKFVFPLFAEDFIKHISEEEHGLFAHLLALKKARHPRSEARTLHRLLNEFDLAHFAHHHQNDDDDMEGIRHMTGNYAVSDATGTYTKVLFKALQDFEHELQHHSQIENKVLMPKGLLLQKQIANILRLKAHRN